MTIPVFLLAAYAKNVRANLTAAEIAKGEAGPKTYRIHVPAELDVRAIRKHLKLTQEGFAVRNTDVHR